MKALAAAMKTFASRFGLPAYAEGSIPDPVELPYISYSLSEPEWSAKASAYLHIWYRSTSNTDLLTKADQVVAAIGEGLVLDINGGHVAIWPESPLVQLMVDGDFRSAYINLSVNSYHMPGV